MADGYLNFDTKINEKGFNDGISKLGKLGKSGLKVATRAVTALGAAAGTGIAAAVKVGAAFEAEMSKVSAISGATGEDFQKLTDKAKEMGAKTKFSATESAQAMEYMAMAGWKTSDMLNGIEGIMNLAAASGEDLATTSDIVTDALTAMGLQASDSGHFADVLAAASSNANTNVSMMGETFKYAAPLAGALGYNIEDLSMAIGLMANSGIKGGQAGTTLRSILTRLAKPPKEAAEAMDQYGISLKNSDGSMKSLMEVMENMRDSLQELPEDEQSAAAAAIGGQEAMSGLLAIVNASESDFDKLSSAIDNADGAAAEMAATMQDNLAGQLTILKSGLEGLGISIYESLEKPLKEVAAVAVSVISDLNDAYNSGGFVGFVDEIGQKIPMIQGFTDAISGLAEKTKGMSSAELKDFGKTALVLTGIAPGLLGLGKAVGTVKTAVGGFNGIIDGTVGKIGKIPGTVKSVSSSLNNAGGMFKALGKGDLVDDCPVFEVHFDGINITEVTKMLEIAQTNKDLSNKLAEISQKMTGKYAYAYTTYLDAEKSTKTSLTLNSIKATGHGRKCILMCWGAVKVTTLTARLSVYVNGKDSCSGITSSTSYVPVFDSNIITLPEGENTIEIRLSAQANTATAYIGRYHKLGFIVAEL